MKKALIIVSVILGISIVLNLILLFSKNKELESFEEVSREVKVDTIPYYEPIPVDSFVIHHVTERLPVGSRNDLRDESITAHVVIDTVGIANVPDSVSVVLPITQKVYEDSLYRAYVSGYKPALDSIFINQRTETIYIRSPVKTKRWGIGLQVGCGVNMKGVVSPYLGVGVSYNLFSF